MRALRVVCGFAFAVLAAAGPSCSVFPEHALLPNAGAAGKGELNGESTLLAGEAGSGVAASGGQDSGGQDSGGQDSGGQPSGGQPSGGQDSGGQDSGGQPSGGQPSGGQPSGGQPSGGSTSCGSVHVIVAPTADAWIDAAEPKVNHGADAELFVLGVPSEQRALFAFSLPPVPTGKPLVAATLVLTLRPAPSSHLLVVHEITPAFNESRVTWLNQTNGTPNKWATPGGDFVPSPSGSAQTSAELSLRLDATAIILPAYSKQQAAIGLLVRDAGTNVAGSGNLALVSREGAAAERPFLDIEYCPL